MFTPKEGDTAVLYRKGRYFVCPLFMARVTQTVFAKQGTGFIMLRADGSTSDPNTRLVRVDAQFALYEGPFSRLTYLKTPKSMGFSFAIGEQP